MSEIAIPLRLSKKLVRCLAAWFLAQNIILCSITWLCMTVYQHPERFPASWHSYTVMSALREFNTQEENCIADWLKSLGHSMPAWGALLCFSLDWRLGKGSRRDFLIWGWLALAAIFVLMSFDEIASIHERLGSLTSLNPFHHADQQLGWVYVLVVPIAAVALGMLVFAWRRVLGTSRAAFILMTVGIMLYGSKPVHEKVEMSMWAAAGWVDNWARPPILDVAEEASEMFGGFFVALGIATYALTRLNTEPESQREPMVLRVPTRAAVLTAALLVGVLGGAMWFLEILPLEMSEELGIPKLWFPCILSFLAFGLLWRLRVITATFDRLFKNGYTIAALFCLWLSMYWGANLYGFVTLGHFDFIRKALMGSMFLLTPVLGIFLIRQSQFHLARLGYLCWSALIFYALCVARMQFIEFGYLASSALLLSLVADSGKRSVSVEPS